MFDYGFGVPSVEITSRLEHDVAVRARSRACQRKDDLEETVRTMPKKLQRLIGYHSFGLGVDGRDPLDVLEDGIVVNPEAKLANEWRETY